MMSLLERGVRTMSEFSKSLAVPPEAKKVRIETSSKNGSGLDDDSNSEDSSSGSRSSNQEDDVEIHGEAVTSVLHDDDDLQNNDNDDDDELSKENDTAIEFLQRILKGQPIEEASLEGGLTATRQNDLVSAIHWMGLELNETIRMGLLLSALEASSRTMKFQISHMAMTQGEWLYLSDDAVTDLVTKEDKTKILTIELPGLAQVRVENNRLKVESMVPGSLNVITKGHNAPK